MPIPNRSNWIFTEGHFLKVSSYLNKNKLALWYYVIPYVVISSKDISAQWLRGHLYYGQVDRVFSLDKMNVDRLTVDKMPLEKMTLSKMIVDKRTMDKIATQNDYGQNVCRQNAYSRNDYCQNDYRQKFLTK